MFIGLYSIVSVYAVLCYASNFTIEITRSCDFPVYMNVLDISTGLTIWHPTKIWAPDNSTTSFTLDMTGSSMLQIANSSDMVQSLRLVLLDISNSRYFFLDQSGGNPFKERGISVVGDGGASTIWGSAQSKVYTNASRVEPFAQTVAAYLY